jgi:hypothetical protein
MKKIKPRRMKMITNVYRTLVGKPVEIKLHVRDLGIQLGR